MVEVQVCDLIGPALDWAVFCAAYKGMQPTIHVIEASTHQMRGLMKPIAFPRAVSLSYTGAYEVECAWNPSINWAQGGPLIQKYGCDLNCISPANCWESNCWDQDLLSPGLHLMEAETPLIAACRAIVAARLGEVVSVPAELVQP